MPGNVAEKRHFESESPFVFTSARVYWVSNPLLFRGNSHSTQSVLKNSGRFDSLICWHLA